MIGFSIVDNFGSWLASWNLACIGIVVALNKRHPNSLVFSTIFRIVQNY